MDFDHHQLSQQALSALSQIAALAQRVDRLEQQVQQLQQRPQTETLSPRLHVAALIAAGWASNPDIDQSATFKDALAIADKLIKEANKS